MRFNSFGLNFRKCHQIISSWFLCHVVKFWCVAALSLESSFHNWLICVLVLCISLYFLYHKVLPCSQVCFWWRFLLWVLLETSKFNLQGRDGVNESPRSCRCWEWDLRWKEKQRRKQKLKKMWIIIPRKVSWEEHRPGKQSMSGRP